MSSELVIYTDKKVYTKLCNTGFIWLILMLSLLLFMLRSHSTGYTFTFFKWGIILGCVGIISYLCYCVYRITRKTPMAVINSKGIWIKQFDIIPWTNILKIDQFKVMGVPTQALAIYVRDIQALSRQASCAGKMIILESKVLKTPTIVIDNIELDYATIARFIDQYHRSYTNAYHD